MSSSRKRILVQDIQPRRRRLITTSSRNDWNGVVFSINQLLWSIWIYCEFPADFPAFSRVHSSWKRRLMPQKPDLFNDLHRFRSQTYAATLSENLQYDLRYFTPIPRATVNVTSNCATMLHLTHAVFRSLPDYHNYTEFAAYVKQFFASYPTIRTVEIKAPSSYLARSSYPVGNRSSSRNTKFPTRAWQIQLILDCATEPIHRLILDDPLCTPFGRGRDLTQHPPRWPRSNRINIGWNVLSQMQWFNFRIEFILHVALVDTTLLWIQVMSVFHAIDNLQRRQGRGRWSVDFVESLEIQISVLEQNNEFNAIPTINNYIPQALHSRWLHLQTLTVIHHNHINATQSEEFSVIYLPPSLRTLKCNRAVSLSSTQTRPLLELLLL